jgi:hypothetical protein
MLGSAEPAPIKTFLLIAALWCSATLVLADDSYFPIKTKDGVEGVTAFEAQWYCKSLERMNEPRLPELAKDVNAEVYRITIFPTWGNAIAIRVSRHGDSYSLSARRLNGLAGFETGKLVEVKDIELGAEDSKALEALVQSLNFFQFSTDDGVIGTDGDEWILEGVSLGRYHVAKRWCASEYNPDKRGLRPFLALCRFLVDKSSLSERAMNKGHKLI